MKKNRYQSPRCVVTSIELASMIVTSIEANGLDGMGMAKPGATATEADANGELDYNIWDE